jgi:hypothetical protein
MTVRELAPTKEIRRSASFSRPHSVLVTHPAFAEPNENWTVEEVYQWTLLRSYQMIDDKYQGMADNLRSQLVQGAENMKAVATQSSKTQVEQQTENRPQNGAANAKVETETNNNVPSTSVTLQAVVQAGDHVGRTFELRLTRKGAPCWIGRSQGKKFRHNGISLPKDLEVSTTHGKIELRDGIVQFTDTGSTNGSKVDGKNLEADEPIPLTTGTLLTVGQTQMEIRLA